MSDSEEEDRYSFYGTPLEPYDEDAFPKKKPIPIEEQVAKDEHGRRRFHGAFTGGFSAGFFNTVGSLEGWTPGEFRSSRKEKTASIAKTPIDFMDDEDLGEFGIAPQVIQATKEYAQPSKRKRDVFTSGPIPGEPVLQSLIESGNETVGYYILKNMTQKQKKEIKSQIETSGSQKVYGCEMPTNIENVEEIEETYTLPDIYNEYLSKSKMNTTGLGYIGLATQQLATSKTSNLTVKDKNNKKLSISGQAFGVGAFEDEDEDIYSKDDMSKYDFELTSEKQVKKPTYAFNEFVLSKTPFTFVNNFPPPVIPSSFTGKHNVKKSRFEPLPKDKETPEETLPKRKDINAMIRAQYLGDDDDTNQHSDTSDVKRNNSHVQLDASQRNNSNLQESEKNELSKESDSLQQQFTSSNPLFDRFVSASRSDDHTDILKSVERYEVAHGTKEMRDAVKLKLFGPLTRITFTWQPCSLLCKRFNVPEPCFNDKPEPKKRTKHLIFEYQKHVETKSPYTAGLSTTSSFLDKQNVTEREEIRTNFKVENDDKVVENNLIETVEKSLEVVENKSDLSIEQSESAIHIKEEEEIEVKDYTEKIDVSKQTDLFKAIFLSSSESEDEENDENEQETRNALIKEGVLGETLVPKIKATKSGILSNIDFSALNKNDTQPSSSGDLKEKDTNLNEGISVEQVDNGTYGPKLPEKKVVCQSATFNLGDVSSGDEWVEKDSDDKKHKHSKRKKKKKEKHKERHKHKSKRKD